MPDFAVRALARQAMTEWHGAPPGAHGRRLRRHDHAVAGRVGGSHLDDDSGGVMGILPVVRGPGLPGTTRG